MTTRDGGAAPLLRRWLELLNDNHDLTLTHAVLDPALVIITHIEGRSKPGTRLSGLDEVLPWLRRAEPGTFAFEVVSAAAGTPDPELPAADEVIAARYKVSSDTMMGRWTNHGDWTLHGRDGRVVGLRGLPDDLPADYREAFDDSGPDGSLPME